jgi:hypothetical protein
MCAKDQSVSGLLIFGYLRKISSSLRHLPIRHARQQKTALRKHTDGPLQLHPHHDTNKQPTTTSTEKMPSWPSSTSSPENNEDEMPWHAAVLPALGFVKLTKMAMVVSPGWEK